MIQHGGAAGRAVGCRTVSFGDLLVIVLAGIGGPLLALGGRLFVPVIIGEILAGVLVGRTGLGAVHPANPTVAFLGSVGFAMLMLTAGMHLPLRDRRVAASLRRGALLAAIVGVLAVPAGLPRLRSRGPRMRRSTRSCSRRGRPRCCCLRRGDGRRRPRCTGRDGAGRDRRRRDDRLGTDRAAAGAHDTRFARRRARRARRCAAVRRGAAAGGHEWVSRVRARSKHRHWALDLRFSLLVLFFLAWLAQESGTSVLIAGFGAGVTVALIGGPKRLSTQIRGVADGFFVPLYFVVLGAQLDLDGLLAHPSMLALAAALAVLNVAIHLLAAVLGRVSLGAGLAASAQLGVPAAVASLGLAEGVLSSGVATAIVASSLVSLAVCTLGVQRLLTSEGERPRTLAS